MIKIIKYYNKSFLPIRSFSLFVKSEQTPNPRFRKFYPGVEFTNSRPNYQISSAKEAKDCKIALELFGIPGVVGVFVGTNYFSIGIDDEL